MTSGAEIKSAFRKSMEEYLSDLKRRGYSEETIKGYRWPLRQFFCWLGECNPGLTCVGEISREQISDYQMHLFARAPERKKRGRKEKKLSMQTQYSSMGALCWFFRWLLEEEKILINPAAAVRLPRPAKRIPRNYLSLREMQKLLSATKTDTHIGLRDRAILETLYSTGLRNSELRALKIDDLDLREGVLAVRCGKGRKDRMSPLGKAAVYFLQAYLEKSRPSLIGQKTHEFIFINKYGNPLSLGALCELVGKRAKDAGVKRPITPHSLRHTCATLMLRGHADIRHIQELLGHNSLSTTQVYTRVEITDLKKVHARCHPREKEPIEKK